MSKKFITIIAIFASIILMGTAIADDDDFSNKDYVKAINGEKDLIGARLEGADFRNKDLSGVDFRGAELEEANFENANLTNANFKNADLEEANLTGANIKGANFDGAELEFARWIDGKICAEGSISGCW